ncbi:DUF1707 domain-containing protein [Phytohabitans sp. ZYX-F-186]|uniref:DUF1707 domain-containing protein n=1 Tax=Phytohabitans maris TaxID=3071409 RepID=A0ABU0Z8H6_9ACTN|nr:DUF1707 domain-containing protein [Phytohabitans sp. ZYX-F-186]MDQ7903308.1 DUF1707 domain-containing protein [Phytohabitans sp. ZYX-F-186]
MSGELRASDEDRHRVVDALHRHTEAGRLSLDEFTERVDSAYAARTLAELAAVTRDLPAESARTAPAAPDTGRRDLLVIFAVAGVALVLLLAFMALTR